MPGLFGHVKQRSVRIWCICAVEKGIRVRQDQIAVVSEPADQPLKYRQPESAPVVFVLDVEAGDVAYSEAGIISDDVSDRLLEGPGGWIVDGTVGAKHIFGVLVSYLQWFFPDHRIQKVDPETSDFDSLIIVVIVGQNVAFDIHDHSPMERLLEFQGEDVPVEWFVQFHTCPFHLAVKIVTVILYEQTQ